MRCGAVATRGHGGRCRRDVGSRTRNRARSPPLANRITALAHGATTGCAVGAAFIHTAHRCDNWGSAHRSRGGPSSRGANAHRRVGGRTTAALFVAGAVMNQNSLLVGIHKPKRHVGSSCCRNICSHRLRRTPRRHTSRKTLSGRRRRGRSIGVVRRRQRRDLEDRGCAIRSCTVIGNMSMRCVFVLVDGR